MARATEWRRGTAVFDVGEQYYGWLNLGGIEPGETLIRTRWNLVLWTTYGDQATYPAGSSITKAGIIFQPVGTVDVDTPISQPESDWIDLRTMPWRVSLALSTEAAWHLAADAGTPDPDAKAMRKNDTEDTLSLYVSWETMLASDTVSGFFYRGAATADMLVALAP
jgi:hypothetical protein